MSTTESAEDVVVTGDVAAKAARGYITTCYPLVSIEKVDRVLAEGGHWAITHDTYDLYDEHGDVIAMLSCDDEGWSEVDNWLFVDPLPRSGRKPSWAR